MEAKRLAWWFVVGCLLATSWGASTSKKIVKKSTEGVEERGNSTDESLKVPVDGNTETLPDTDDTDSPSLLKEDAPVVFKLLDEEEEESHSKGHEGRSKFPRVYYGEVEEQVKGKKRYEYSHEVDHASPNARQEGEEEYYGGHRETDHYGYGGRSPSYGDEYGDHREPHYGYQQHQYGPPAYRYHHAAAAIGKALQVLIPSALVLTGVSALFPNRIKVATNDYSNNNPQHQRTKRSLEYTGGFEGPSAVANDFMRPEHRAVNSEEDAYAYNIGRYGEYLPSDTSNEFSEASPMFKEFGNKVDPSGTNEVGEGKPTGSFGNHFMSRPSTPQEYDTFNFSPQVYNFVVPENTYDAEGLKSEPTEVIPTVTTTQDAPKTSMKRRRRPNRPVEPTMTAASTAASPGITEGIQNIIPYKKMPTEASVTSTSMASSSPARELSTANEKLEQVLNNLQALQAMGTQASLLLAPKPVTTTSKSVDKDGNVDLSPDGPVMGLITSYATHNDESPSCQKRALCDLAMRGRNHGASKFESFLWNLATLVPEEFSKMYELEDIFKGIKEGDCKVFDCATPNLDIQV